MARIGVITFPGTLDDVDAMRAVRLAGGQSVPLWHKDTDLKGVDAVVVPGGFSYGDYLRCGAIARFAPVMEEVFSTAGQGLPALAICNGFQLLTEAHLLAGALIRDDHQKFICRDQRLRVENVQTAWTNGSEAGEEIVVPMKNGEGGFVASDAELDRLEGEGLVVFRYLGDNPNGSARDIAGLRDARGNVVGLMPHPERAVEPGFGLATPAGPRSGTDGLRSLPPCCTRCWLSAPVRLTATWLRLPQPAAACPNPRRPDPTYGGLTRPSGAWWAAAGIHRAVCGGSSLWSRLWRTLLTAM